MKVYLSGGFRSGWQDLVKDAVHGCTMLDPRWVDELGVKSSRAYTTWDLRAIDGCDVVFAYLEEGNPPCIGLVLEIGYAKAKGKLTILVDEKPLDQEFDILRATADVIVPTLDEGKAYLQSLIRLEWNLLGV